MEVICSNINDKCVSELVAMGTKLRNPRLIIYNIPDEVTLDNAKEAAIEQNSEMDIIGGDIAPKFTFKDKKQNNHLVIEANSQTWKKLIDRKVKIGWNICMNEHYIKVNRCFKCNKFNHRATDCKGQLPAHFVQDERLYSHKRTIPVQ